jgi:hypothetical protein
LNVDAPGDTFGSQGIARGRQQRPRLNFGSAALDCARLQ